MRRPYLAVLIPLIALLSSDVLASPCRSNGWQPTFVHDLTVNSATGPFYVMPNGRGFVSLGPNPGNWVNRACELIRNNGLRNRRGFTNCQNYTRVQCGCDDSSRSNSTCRAFLRDQGR